MLGFSPLSSATLASTGDAPVPSVIAPVTGVQALGQVGVTGFTTVQQPTQEITGVEATGEVTPVQTSRNPSALLYPWEMEAQLGNVVALSVADVNVSGQELTTEVGTAPTVSLITTRVVPLTGFDLTNSLGNVSVDGIVVDFETLAQNFEIARNVTPEALASRKVFPIAGSRRLAA